LKWHGHLGHEITRAGCPCHLKLRHYPRLRHFFEVSRKPAEHAIKAFARLRRAIEGLSTPKGIEECLILLSVYQTCKYSGLDFIGFLRSGETDIGSFAASQHSRAADAMNLAELQNRYDRP